MCHARALVALLSLGCTAPDMADAPFAAAPGVPERACAGEDPGHLPLQRLHLRALDASVRALLGRGLPAAVGGLDVPPGNAFDTNAALLTTSGPFFEALERAVDEAVTDALRGAPTSEIRSLGEPDRRVDVDADVVWAAAFETPGGGRHRLSWRAGCARMAETACLLAWRVDDADAATLLVDAPADAPALQSVDFDLSSGRHRLSATLLNGTATRRLQLSGPHLEGPLDAVDPKAAAVRAELVPCVPAGGGVACARLALAAFGGRAWRRPLTSPELERLVGLFTAARAAGDAFETALGIGFRALLLSPRFLYVVETDGTPDTDMATDLSDRAWATRIARFVWSAPPDARLAGLAEKGALTGPGGDSVVRAEVDRLLADPRSAALSDALLGQWLSLDALSDVAPAPDLDAPLRAAMRRQAEDTWAEFFQGRHDLRDLLDARFTHLDARLAVHLGRRIPPGAAVGRAVRVADPRGTMGGLLRQSALLTVTSFPDRTSTPRRGRWVLEHLLCEPVGAPPAISGDPTGGTCRRCHAQLDALGARLEGFGPRGAPRLPPGEADEGPRELAAQLREDPRFTRCLVRQVFTYAVGRGPEANDACALDLAEQAFLDGDGRLPVLIAAIVLSEPFRARRGEVPPP
jgi:hypothetical protein